MKTGQIKLWILATALVLLAPAVVSAQGTLFVEGDRVGIGIDTPDEALHIFRSDGTATFKVEETNGTASSRTLMQLENNGGIRFNMKTGADTWQFNALAHFIINFSAHAGNELRLLQNGDLEIAGSLSQGSSRDIKHSFAAVNGRDVLAAVAELPLSTWRYTADEQQAQHLGPMAEDFHAAFGLGSDERHLAPADVAGVALAAIQGLQSVVEEKDQELQELKLKVERLEALLESRLSQD